MKKTVSIIMVLCALMISSAKAQLESNLWYFGSFSGLDFSTNPPTYLTNGKLWYLEGGGTISDASGNLLFYTDGVTVYNKNHVFMANGTGLLGNMSTTQSGVIVKQPGNTNIYYIFTLDEWGDPDGLQYSIVDMSLAAGLGSVTAKNIPLHTPSCEKLVAVRHCNGKDAWIVSHDYGSNTFRTFLLDATGLNTTPVLSSVGFNAANTLNFTQGQMKISPNGRKLGVVYNNTASPGAIELYDFDPATGLVTNPLQLSVTADGYGCEFSPDGTKFYAGLYMSAQLWQYDLCAGSNAAIIASKSTFTAQNTSFPLGSLQRAPDGKIYIQRNNAQYLSTINTPNASGASCNFIDNSFSIAPNYGMVGLPNFINSYSKPVTAPFTFSLSCQTAWFTAPPPATTTLSGCNPLTYSANSVQWDFGDPASGSANSSTVTNPFHTYSGTGTFTTSVILYYACYSDTVRLPVTITSTVPVVSVAGTSSVCAGQSLTLTASGAGTYSWSNGPGSATIAVTPPSSGGYTVTGFSGTCVSQAVHDVTVHQGPALVIASNNESPCQMAQMTMTVSGGSTYTWTGVPVSQVSASVVNITLPNNAGPVSYTVNSTGVQGCTSAKTHSIMVLNCTGLGQPGSMEALRIFPNPASDLMTLQIYGDGDYSLTVCDITGRKVLEEVVSSKKNTVSVAALPEGLYTCQVIDRNARYIIKLAVTR